MSEQIDPSQLKHVLRQTAHDLRDMLVPILGYGELLRQADDPKVVATMAERMLEGAERIQTLADTLVERVMEGAMPSPEDGPTAG